MRQFIANGYLVLRPDVPGAVHDRVVRMATKVLRTIRAHAPVSSLARLLNADSVESYSELKWGWSIRKAVNVTAAPSMARLGREAAASRSGPDQCIEKPARPQIALLVGEPPRQIGTPTGLAALMDDLTIRHWDDWISVERGF